MKTKGALSKIDKCCLILSYNEILPVDLLKSLPIKVIIIRIL